MQLLNELIQVKKELNSFKIYSKEDAFKTNLSMQLKLLENTNANKNLDVLKTMINNVDNLFLKL